MNVRMIPVAVLGCIALSSACDDADEPADTDGSTTSDAGAVGPNIVEVAASATAVGEGEFVELTVVVTHGEMLDELVGGLVRLQDTVLGPLVQVSNGVYTFGVTFNELSEITGESGGSIALEIELLDNAGMAASTTVEVDVCRVGSAVCSPGMCMDVLMSNANCGSCGNTCDSNEECSDGFCEYMYEPPGTESGYYADVDDYDDAFAQDDAVSTVPIPVGTPAGPDLAAFNL
ncbi:MAG: hypothetical protein AAGA54_28560 [Myxococcota bacterium]